jgi:CO/xanthine dehydrogenase Mo-binding subunit
VTFDKGAVTSQDCATYPILTMAEMPELKVVIAKDLDAAILWPGFGKRQHTGCGGYCLDAIRCHWQIDPRDPRQLCGTQEGQGLGIARSASALDLPLCAHLVLMAQSR